MNEKEQVLNEEEFKKLKVYVTERTNKETGEKFNSYKVVTKQGKIDLKFTKEVKQENLPTHLCLVVARKNKINVNQKTEFPVMWCSEIHHLEEIEFTQNVDDYLD